MSGEKRSSNRKTLRFDYSEYNKRGVKVPLDIPDSGRTEAPLVSSLGISVVGPPSGEGPEGTTLIEALLVSSLGNSVVGPPSGEGPIGTTTKICIMDRTLDKVEGFKAEN